MGPNRVLKDFGQKLKAINDALGKLQDPARPAVVVSALTLPPKMCNMAKRLQHGDMPEPPIPVKNKPHGPRQRRQGNKTTGKGVATPSPPQSPRHSRYQR